MYGTSASKNDLNMNKNFISKATAMGFLTTTELRNTTIDLLSLHTSLSPSLSVSLSLYSSLSISLHTLHVTLHVL